MNSPLSFFSKNPAPNKANHNVKVPSARPLLGTWLQWIISVALAVGSVFMVSWLTQLSGSSSGAALSLTLAPGMAVIFFTRQWRTFGWWVIPAFLAVITDADYTIAALFISYLLLFRRGLFLNNPKFDRVTGRFSSGKKR